MQLSFGDSDGLEELKCIESLESSVLSVSIYALNVHVTI